MCSGSSNYTQYVILTRNCHLEVWPFFDLLGLLLWWPLELVLLLVALEAPQLLLNAPPLLPHLLAVLLIEQRKLTTDTQGRDTTNQVRDLQSGLTDPPLMNRPRTGKQIHSHELVVFCGTNAHVRVDDGGLAHGLAADILLAILVLERAVDL